MFCFFFQAEDGIRDYKVTGVQTCALPILVALNQLAIEIGRNLVSSAAAADTAGGLCEAGDERLGRLPADAFGEADRDQIGRASCRERVMDGVVGGGSKKRRKESTGDTST